MRDFLKKNERKLAALAAQPIQPSWRHRCRCRRRRQKESSDAAS